jgi:hypothetical protein
MSDEQFSPIHWQLCTEEVNNTSEKLEYHIFIGLLPFKYGSFQSENCYCKIKFDNRLLIKLIRRTAKLTILCFIIRTAENRPIPYGD